jgi:hypothetical protein
MYQSDSAPWLEFFAWNTDGTAKTDLVYNTSGISIVVVRDNLANSSALTLSAASGPTDWAAGKFWAMGGNKYRVGIATASISSFTGQISVEGSYTGGVLTGVTREVSAYNPTRNPSIAGDAMGLSDGAITAAKIASDAIATTKIEDGAFTAAKFAASSLNGKGDWLLASGYTAPSNSTIASIDALLQLTDSDVASILTLLGTPAGASIAADLATIKLSADAALRPIVAGRQIAVAATTGAVELDSATETKINKIEAAVAGTVTGAGTSTEVFVGPSATLTITVDASGNRSAVVVT